MDGSAEERITKLEVQANHLSSKIEDLSVDISELTTTVRHACDQIIRLELNAEVADMVSELYKDMYKPDGLIKQIDLRVVKNERIAWAINIGMPIAVSILTAVVTAYLIGVLVK